MESARPATAADVVRLVELAEQAIAELTPTKGGDIWARREARRAPYDESFVSDLAADDRRVLVGEIEGAVIGYAVVHLELLHDNRLLGVVTDIYVEPEARDVSVGECLMDAIVAWCSARGCVGIDSLALPGNRATKNFFETFGLVARAIVVHRRLDGDETDAS
jgi:ribosomal protein S18 acetylase RimI-like enzyme